jgi:hypothetical protein
MTAMPETRSWQLLMVGPGSAHITPDLHGRLVRLLDLLPQTRLIEIDTDAGSVSVSRDCWTITGSLTQR